MSELDQDCRFGNCLVQPSANTIVREGLSTQISPRVMDVLMYLIVHHHRIVTSDELLEKYWPGRVVEESTIHRHISQVRAALGDTARDANYIKTISKKGYQAVAEVVDIAAGAADYRDQLLTTLESIDTIPETLSVVEPPFWRKHLMSGFLAAVAIVALVFVTQMFLVDAARTQQFNHEKYETMAVLPFVNLSTQVELGYFGQGLADGVLDEFAGLDYPQVPSRTTTFQLVEQGLGLQTLAARLNVAYVLEGSLQQIGAEVRIVAQLIRAADDFHVWSKTYTRQLEGGFEMQEEVGANIAHLARLTMHSDIERQQPELFEEYLGVHPDAVNLYIDAEEIYAQVTAGEPGTLRMALQLHEKAVDIDPNFSQAHWQIAWYHTYRTDGELPVSERRRAAHHAFENYRRLQPDALVPLSLMAQIQIGLDLDYAGAARTIRQGQLESPDFGAWEIFQSMIAMREGRHDEVRRLLKNVEALDHFSDIPLILRIFQLAYLFNGDFERSLAVSERALALITDGTERVLILVNRALVMVELDRLAEARAVSDEAWSLGKAEVPEVFIELFVRLGEVERARAILPDVVPKLRTRGALVAGYMALGEHELALDQLAAGIETLDASVLSNIRWQPILDPLRDDARFLELMALLESKENNTEAYFLEKEQSLSN